MGKPFSVLLTLAVTVIVLGIVGYLNFYKPEKGPPETTAINNTAEETPANPIQKSPISDQEAIEKIRQLPDVKKYLRDVPTAKILIDHEEPETNSWVIHVFEIKNGHTATFNWYTVDKMTGKITAEFDISSVQDE